MRLEINSGGLDSFFNGVSSFTSSGINTVNNNNLINSFQTVQNKTNNICGGVGTLGVALGYIQIRKSTEEARNIAVENVKSKTDSLIQTSLRVDNEVATMVRSSQEEFYKTNPWLRPPSPPSDWDRFWGGVADTAKECWDGVVDFYIEHKKIIDTILIVAVAIFAVAVVFITGGMALTPMLAAGLSFLGVGAGTALTIATYASLAVAGIAVLSGVFSSALNVIDIWWEIDNPAFNAWQKGLNKASAWTNGFYSLGSFYNASHGITNQALKSYSRAWLNDSEFRSAISGANKFNFTLDPNKSTFWAGLGEDGAKSAQETAAISGRSTLAETLNSQKIPLPTDWRPASASFALRSSGEVQVLLGDGLGKILPDGRIIGEIWSNTESILLNINPYVTGIQGVARTFQIGSLFTGIISFEEAAISASQIKKN